MASSSASAASLDMWDNPEPTDGGMYELQEGNWFCCICNKVAADGHLRCKSHLWYVRAHLAGASSRCPAALPDAPPPPTEQPTPGPPPPLGQAQFTHEERMHAKLSYLHAKLDSIFDKLESMGTRLEELHSKYDTMWWSLPGE